MIEVLRLPLKNFDFLMKNYVQHIQIATDSPQANGQVEQMNRIITLMLAKLVDII